MFTIKIADVTIRIENKYQYVWHLCEDYIEEKGEPEFTVSVLVEEICEEQEASPVPCSKSYAESLCIFRKICNRLIYHDAFLMHSAVIEVDSQAYVFAAKSGTGKTTHMRLWMEEFGERARIVNGDKPIFRFINGVLYAYGTPWRGKEALGSNIMAPVKAICFLEQSPENHIRRLGEGEVIGRIFHQLLMPREEMAMNHFMDMIDRVLSTVDCYLLQCNMERQAALTAYGGMRGQAEGCSE